MSNLNVSVNGRSRGKGNAVSKAIFGILLVVVSSSLIGWNERNAVRELRAIDEIDKIALADVRADEVLADNDGTVVHVAGRASTDQIVGNTEFEIEENAIRVSWDSSIYQMVEDVERGNGDRKYTYSREWVNSVVDSSSFRSRKSSNNGSRKTLPVDARSQANDVSLEAFTLSTNLIDQIDSDEQLRLSNVPDELAADGGVINEGVFFTGDPDDPEIGDEKIEFEIVRIPVDVTVLARQRGATFESYATESGKDKEILYVGQLSKDEVISKQHSAARILRWSLRAVSFLVIWAGIGMLFDPVTRLLRPVPLLGRVVEIAAFVASGVLAVVMSVSLIAVFWFLFRPLLSLTLVVLAGATVFVAVLFADRAQKKADTERAAARAEEIAAFDSGRSPVIEGYKVLHGQGPEPGVDQSQIQDSAPTPPPGTDPGQIFNQDRSDLSDS